MTTTHDIPKDQKYKLLDERQRLVEQLREEGYDEEVVQRLNERAVRLGIEPFSDEDLADARSEHAEATR